MYLNRDFGSQKKRLKVLIRNCDEFLGKIGRFRNQMIGLKKLDIKRKILKKSLENVGNFEFSEKDKVGLRKFEKELDIEKLAVVRSLLKREKILRRKNEFEGEKENKYKVVDYRTMQNEEIKELLKCNRRHFGNHFSEDIKIPEIFTKTTPVTGKTGDEKIVKPKLLKRKMIKFRVKEGRKISEIIKIEKMLHEKVQKY